MLYFFLRFFGYFVACQIEVLQCFPPNWFFILSYAVIAVPIPSVIAKVCVVLMSNLTEINKLIHPFDFITPMMKSPLDILAEHSWQR